MGLTKITLEVNISTTPRELQRDYAQLRQELLRGRRLRSVAEKNARLAAFVARIRDREVNKEHMDKWNESYPRWKYREFKLFNRDWRMAQARIEGSTKEMKDLLTPYLGRPKVSPDTGCGVT